MDSFAIMCCRATLKNPQVAQNMETQQVTPLAICYGTFEPRTLPPILSQCLHIYGPQADRAILHMSHFPVSWSVYEQILHWKHYNRNRQIGTLVVKSEAAEQP